MSVVDVRYARPAEVGRRDLAMEPFERDVGPPLDGGVKPDDTIRSG
jgi:hypothetical protein